MRLEPKPLLLLALALILATPAFAQSERKPARKIPAVNDLVETGGPVQLRASSPDPSFGGKGAQIGWVKAGEILEVLQVKNYVSVFGTEIWMEIRKKDHVKTQGWIFAGLANEISKGKSVISVYVDPETRARQEAAAEEARAAAEAMARTDSLILDE